jgi:hypothetical protein
MPTGTSRPYYPEQANPKYQVELENSYFLVKLHEAQAFFEAGWLVRPGYLIFSSKVESSFQPDSPMQSLHKITTIQKNVPCKLGIGINLTDWLPSRTGDSLHIEIQQAVIQDSPIKNLLERMDSLGLVAQLTTARPDLKAAIKVSQIAGELLSLSLNEGGSQEIFRLAIDLPLIDLKAGYYAAVGSEKEMSWPEGLKIRGDGQNACLIASEGDLSRFSYAVIQVLAFKRRGEEMARDEAWWELLEAGKEQALDACPINDVERRKVWESWRSTLAQAKRMANKDRIFLKEEIGDIFKKAQVEVQQALMPSETLEAYGDHDLPEAWKEVLGVNTEEELYSSVKDYKDALELSKKLVESYGI